MLIPLGFLGVAGALVDIELISTQVLGSSGNVAFTSIPSTYKHLQLRIVGRDAGSSGGSSTVNLTMNSLTSLYSQHALYATTATPSGGGSSANSAIQLGYVSGGASTANAYGFIVADFLDYANTSKNVVVRSIHGNADGSSGGVGIRSGFYNGLITLSRIDISTANGFAAGSRFSLYGIKG